MPFTTLSYFFFFVTVWFLYRMVPMKAQWLILLLGSFVFYGFLSPIYLVFLFVTIGITYGGTLWIGRIYHARDELLREQRDKLSRDERKVIKVSAERTAYRILTLVVVLLLAMMAFFKYGAFLFDNIARLVNLVVGYKLSGGGFFESVILPIGLSFYMFQSIGYCIDVAREEVSAEHNLWRHALFVSYFPQLMQGPIGNYGRLAPQLFASHPFDYRETVFGLQRVAWGLFKKFMIANVVAGLINPCWGDISSYPGMLTWLFVLTCYAIQLYADFSGYMDIACGCSQMLGIKIDENFNLPYFARNIPDFWRRWHMTLSSWFKDYLFYPVLRSDWNGSLRKHLSANKYLATVIPTSLALAIVWFATGLWHGASWGYVAWGVYYGIFMILNIACQPLFDRIERMFPRWCSSRFHALLQVVRTFAIVVFGYSIFKPADLSVTVQIWGQLADGFNLSAFQAYIGWFNKHDLMVFVWIAALCLVDLLHLWRPEFGIRRWLANRNFCIRWAVYIISITSVILFGLYGDGFDQFEYFKF